MENINSSQQWALDQSIEQQAQTLMDDPTAWAPITWGLVDQYQNWSLAEGYAITTTNRRVSTIRQYLSIAHKAGQVSTDEMVRARGVTLLSREEGINIDAERSVTRRSTKRAKTHIRSTLADYLPYLPDVGPILRASRKSGELVENPMNQLTISKRVTALALSTIEDPNLPWITRTTERISAHDLRHTWATLTAREPGMTLLRLQEAGGWSSLAMPRRYIEEAKIANEGMVK